MISYTIGIDEAGRGPLAGPLAVGLMLIPHETHLGVINSLALPPLTDSKKLSEAKREYWYKEIQRAQKSGDLSFVVVFISPTYIDKHGVSASLKQAITKGLAKLGAEPESSLIKLDGALKAPDAFQHQQTITKGDETEQIISLASIVAKVERDRKMRKLSAQFPLYEFDRHKGYGTKRHIELIHRYGLSTAHRRSFCGRILSSHIDTQKIMNKIKGFTLIELLVVIAIISLLASVVLASLDAARAQARDAQRLSDVRQVENALELYHNDNGEYPTCSSVADRAPYDGDGTSCIELALEGGGYISQMPADPLVGNNGVPDTGVANGRDYQYGSTSTAEEYIFRVVFEGNPSSLDFTHNYPEVGRDRCLAATIPECPWYGERCVYSHPADCDAFFLHISR